MIGRMASGVGQRVSGGRMGIGGRILAMVGLAGKPAGRRRAVQAHRYDAAETNNQNIRHWEMADSRSANASLRPEIRRKLRNRARYEVHNNSIAIGIVNTLANDTIGIGPRLQLEVPEGVEDDAQVVETLFHRWAMEIDLAGKLRTLRFAKAVDGEGWAIMGTNERLASPVKLDLRLIEADQVASPLLGIETPTKIDGIEYDGFGNPIRYEVLAQHPGDTSMFASPLSSRLYAASDVIHYFKPLRAGQGRGVPEVAPGLELMALLRRYTFAVTRTAERQAAVGGVLETTASADDGPADVDPGEAIDVDHATIQSLPEGWTYKSFDSSQPTTTFPDFQAAIIGQFSRCLGMPYNIAAGDSSDSNYASGRLDHQGYFRSIDVEHDDLARQVMNRVFMKWLQEAVLVEGYLPQTFRSRTIRAQLSPTWMWAELRHVDPVKEATAQEIELRSGTTTWADEWAKKRRDAKSVAAQLRRERKMLDGLHLGFMEPTPGAAPAQTTDTSQQEAAA